MTFLIESFNMVNYTDQLSNDEPALHSWGEIYLVNFSFYVSGLLFATVFLRILTSILMRDN